MIRLSRLSMTVLLGTAIGLSACASKPQTLYDEIGGMQKIEAITDNFIEGISYDKEVARYFSNTNINRFRDKLNEHLCEITNGPCEYTGDDMKTVHTGMNINENHFNQTVDLLVDAMEKADIPLATQNKILAELVPMRKDIIYR